MSRVAANADVRLAYEVDGSGAPLLLIHGLGYDRAGWGGMHEALAERFRVIRFDNRGVGESDVPDGPYSVSALASDAVAVLDAEGLERAHVVGTSLGGMVAQEIALSHAERVERLVLACTMAGGEGSFPLPDRTVAAFARFPTLPLEQGLRMLAENSLADETVARRPELVDELYAYRLAHRPQLAGWQAQAAAGTAFDRFDDVASIRAPTLVIHGTADNVVDVRNADLLVERIPDARLELFDGLGHLFFWEDPQRFARVVGDFLEDAP
ncbi:MAG: alpha/beta fold hydrolase [Actinobacteria bacterium]|nr:alpha/beta fold hydrolase [Actinomycetota bacterium]